MEKEDKQKPSDELTDKDLENAAGGKKTVHPKDMIPRCVHGKAYSESCVECGDR